MIQSLDELERDQLAAALRMLNGNVAAVARHLDLSRDTVYRRAERFDLSPQRFRSRRRR